MRVTAGHDDSTTPTSATQSKETATGTQSTGAAAEEVPTTESHFFRNVFVGLVVLGAGAGVFVYFGGLRKAREIMHQRGYYRRLNSDDLEK